MTLPSGAARRLRAAQTATPTALTARNPTAYAGKSGGWTYRRLPAFSRSRSQRAMPLLIRKPAVPRTREEASVTMACLADVPEMDRIEQAAFATPWSRELIRSAILNRKYQVRVLRTPERSVAGFYISH